jgi:hypothetical protein
MENMPKVIINTAQNVNVFLRQNDCVVSVVAPICEGKRDNGSM